MVFFFGGGSKGVIFEPEKQRGCYREAPVCSSRMPWNAWLQAPWILSLLLPKVNLLLSPEFWVAPWSIYPAPCSLHCFYCIQLLDPWLFVSICDKPSPIFSSLPLLLSFRHRLFFRFSTEFFGVFCVSWLFMAFLAFRQKYYRPSLQYIWSPPLHINKKVPIRCHL